MTTSLALLQADARRVARDPLLLVLGIVPVALAVALRGSVPWLTGRFGQVVDVAAYAEAATAVLLLLTPMMFGFVAGLMLLDERDEGVLLAVALTPVGKRGFLAYRMVIPVLWSMLASGLILGWAAPLPVAPARLAALAVLAGLEAPLLALFLGAFAADKVAGVALAKVGSVLIGLGALTVLLPSPWQWLAATSPHFWLVRLFLARQAPTGPYVALWVLALAVHAGVLWFLGRIYKRRAG